MVDEIQGRCDIEDRVVSFPAKIISRAKLRELLLAETLSIDLGLDELGDEIVLRIVAPPPAEVGVLVEACAAGELNGNERSGVVLP